MQTLSDLTYAEATAPIDPEIFDKGLEAFITAVEGRDPLIRLHEPLPPPKKGDPPTMRLTDIPENRGGLAVARVSREAKLTHMQSMSLLTRIFHFYEAAQSAVKDGRFTAHIIPGDDGLSISRAFQSACASAAFLPKSLKFDLDSILEKINTLEAV